MLFAIITGLTIGGMSLIGVLVNSAVVLIIWRMKVLDNPFYLLTVNLEIIDIVFSTAYLLYVTPLIMFAITFMEDSRNSSICGFILMTAFIAAVFAHTSISLNRFLAVLTPIVYRKVFSSDTTMIVIFVIISSSLFINTFFAFFNCHCYYLVEYRLFTISTSSICDWYNVATDINAIFMMSLFNFILDLISMMKLKWITFKRNKALVSTANSKNDMGYLMQALAQTMFLLIHVVIQRCDFIDEVQLHEYGFLLGSLGWLAIHALDGGIKLFEEPVVSSTLGFILQTCFVCATCTHSFITLNRFFAVSTPIVYRNLFSSFATKTTIVITVLLAFSFNLFFMMFDCGTIYDPEYHSVANKNSFLPACAIYEKIINLYIVFALSTINFFFDVISMMKLRMIIENRNKTIVSTRSAKTDMGYVKQAMAQTLFLLFCVCLFFFAFSSLVRNPDYGFIVTSLGWLVLHAADGVLTFIFNPEMRRCLFSKSNVTAPPSYIGTTRN